MSDLSISTDKSARGSSARRTAAAPGSVTATQLAEHLDLSRQRIKVLADVDHVLERLPDGRFALGASRVKYIRHLRTERVRSPRSEADTALAQAKAETLQLKLAQQKGQLVLKTDVDELFDTICGVTLTALSSLPARCASIGDLATRRAIERAVLEVRREIATVCERMADERGEPPLSEQG
jgi:hypothetical protein